MDKSYVTMEQKACMVCGRKYDTGTIIMDRRLRDSFERYTVTGWGLCQEHTQLYDNGYIALVGVDEAKSDKEPNGSIKPSGAFRTGEIAHLKREAAAKIFNVPIADDLPMVFVEPAIIEMLSHLAPSE
jgi:hypothetical protein